MLIDGLAGGKTARGQEQRLGIVLVSDQWRWPIRQHDLDRKAENSLRIQESGSGTKPSFPDKHAGTR